MKISARGPPTTCTIYGHLVKKSTFRFLKDALVVKFSGIMYQGGLIFVSLSILKSTITALKCVYNGNDEITFSF